MARGARVPNLRLASSAGRAEPIPTEVPVGSLRRFSGVCYVLEEVEAVDGDLINVLTSILIAALIASCLCPRASTALNTCTS